jgi:hypothetical protein
MTMLAVKRGSRCPTGFPSRITWAPVGMTGRDDAFPVDGGMEGIVTAEQAVEAVAHVPGPLDGFMLIGRAVEAVEKQERVTLPQRLIAADMLDVQAGDPARRPSLAEVAVALPCAAEPVGEDDQRDRSLPHRSGWPVEPRRDLSVACRIDPFEVDDPSLLGGRQSSSREGREPRSGTRCQGHRTEPAAAEARGGRFQVCDRTYRDVGNVNHGRPMISYQIIGRGPRGFTLDASRSW